MSDMVNLQATFVPNDGEQFRVRLALDIAIEQVLLEPGCIQYEVTEDTPERIVLTEQWASEEALSAHGKGAAVQDLNESLSALLAAPVKLERL
ncbi:antibiotic biosynthesis monooxygenase [Renibacterium salmoninarum ATCC 33209]|uniref:Antibiotic biosynthesis monooxygenase n=1 Tax=Renibacterium salmoninarum (strain ATCC 33209 / DSM 20767 / JCM 11484 / NBRC 15589 / NCIMB 2235) TaxID=288705 RepID=A9WQM7_RENSM|nr:putative quinol monooxygenase [Renibacterium salmoninarum]ABY22626.1 antibiotic biosynthesis monooxygenase [Renibacterium salmoninarum ATCC 33209]